MNATEAGKIVSMLEIAYSKQVADETMALYIKFLLDIPFEAGKAAALNLIAENKFFPSISEARQAAIAVLPNNQIPTAAEAWSEVTKQIEEASLYKKPSFSHPSIVQATKAIGWYNLCTSENPAADRAHFMRIYETYRERAMRDIVQLPEAKKLIVAVSDKLSSNSRTVKLVTDITERIGKKAI